MKWPPDCGHEEACPEERRGEWGENGRKEDQARIHSKKKWTEKAEWSNLYIIRGGLGNPLQRTARKEHGGGIKKKREEPMTRFESGKKAYSN